MNTPPLNSREESSADLAAECKRLVRDYASVGAICTAIDRLIASLASPSVTVPTDERAWLIEHSGMVAGHHGQVSWLCVALKHEGYGAREFAYTTDAGKALRFARKSDAEEVMKMHMGASPPDWYKKPFSVTEHEWPAARAAVAVPTVQPADNFEGVNETLMAHYVRHGIAPKPKTHSDHLALQDKGGTCSAGEDPNLVHQAELQKVDTSDAATAEPDQTQPQALANEGFETVRVRGLPELIDALERADRKGYLPDAIKEQWNAFDFRWPALPREFRGGSKT